MHYRNKIAMLVAAAFSQQLWAQSVSGVVLDSKGQPIAGAEVSLAGSQARVKTDAAGTFLLAAPAGQLAELHVEAAEFAHRNQHVQVPAAGLTNVELRLLPTLLEVIDVKASPLHASATESALPISVLSGEQLKMQQASTLGDTLKNQVGVHSNFYGSVASSPIIRGLDGPRVLITQNGLDAGDASRVGPDHSVASEAGTAEQIEVLRGPATLFYGSGAIGGVVNVVDERVPTRRDTRANWQLERQSVNNEKLAAAAGQTSVGDVALYADAFWREQDNYKIPGVAEIGSDEPKGGRVANTDATARGGSFGASYLLDNGFVGISMGKLDRQYGIPGHSHGGHAHEAEAGEAAERVFADLEQDRVQLNSQLNFTGGLLSQLNVKAGYTDYQHAEIEAGAVGTTFKNRSEETRLELLHREWLDWRGGLSLHYKHSDFAAVGAEAFTPPSTQEMLALGWMEERHFGPLLWQVGARTERVTIKADQVLLPQLGAHEDDVSKVHGHAEGGDSVIRTFAVDHTFKPYSLSSGLVWEYQDGYNTALSFSHSGRAPAASELLSFGPHIGTNAYEIGALFRLNPAQDAQQAFVLNTAPIEMEVSNNLDLTWRKFSGDVALVLNAFYNQIDNYYYQQDTGLFAESGHDHGHEEHDHEAHDHAHDHDHDHDHDHGDEHFSELPVYWFNPADVTLHGFEAQLIWQFASEWRFTQQADFVRARLDAGGDLPRTPPLRLQSALSWQGEALSAELRFSHYSQQKHTENFEGSLPGYNLLDANVSYYFDLGDQQLAVYLKGQNLTDEDARVHTSFLKDKAPLPGRSLGLGIRGEF